MSSKSSRGETRGSLRGSYSKMEETNEELRGLKLNLGCGKKIIEGYLNADRNDNLGAEIICDLEVFPYPFKDNECAYILMDNVLEHLEDTIKVMEELHRISKPGAIIEIIVPHYSSCGAFSHITHKRFFGSGSFNNFQEDYWDRYSDISFEIIEKRLIWLSCRNWILIRPLKKLIDSLINIHPFISERFFCYPIGGFDGIRFKLKVVKENK